MDILRAFFTNSYMIAMNMDLETAKRFVRNLLLSFEKLLKICRELDDDELWTDFYEVVFTSDRDLDTMIQKARQIDRPDAWKRIRSIINPKNPDYTHKQGRIIADNVLNNELHTPEIEILSPFWSPKEVLDRADRLVASYQGVVTAADKNDWDYEKYKDVVGVMDYDLKLLFRTAIGKTLCSQEVDGVEPAEIIQVAININIPEASVEEKVVRRLLQDVGKSDIAWSKKLDIVAILLKSDLSFNLVDKLNDRGRLSSNQLFELKELHKEYGCEAVIYPYFDLDQLEIDELLELAENEDQPRLWEAVADRMQYGGTKDIYKKCIGDVLDLSPQTFDWLEKYGIELVGELLNHTEDELLEYRMFGRKNLRELKEVLGDRDLSLGSVDIPAQNP